MRWLSRIRAELLGYKVDPDTLSAYRTAIPSTIDLQIRTSGDNYIAKIKTINNEQVPKEVFLITEAESPDALVDMVNDLVFSYKNIPDVYRPYYKRILTPQGSVARTEKLKLVKAA